MAWRLTTRTTIVQRYNVIKTISAPRKRASLRMDLKIRILGPIKANGVTQYLRSLLHAINAKMNFLSIVTIPSQWARVASTMDSKVQIRKIQKGYRSIYSRNYTIYLIKRFIIWQGATLLEITEFRFLFRAWKKFRLQHIMQRLFKKAPFIQV